MSIHYRGYPFYQQLDAMDCGPTCLKMVAKFHGKLFTLDYLRVHCYITRLGVSLIGISTAAEHIGLKTLGVKLSLQELVEQAPLPAILHWNQNHFVVLYDVSTKLFSNERIFILGDPAMGIVKISESAFRKGWLGDKFTTGVALLIETTPAFYDTAEITEERTSFRFFVRYLVPYRSLFGQIIIGMILGSAFSLIFPFLTQAMVDNGINGKNVRFVQIILISQILLFLGGIGIEAIRAWIILHISTRLNISIISDFIIKLMKLPISFFETKLIGDITQRIGDHKRIESFLTMSTLSTLFSLVNLIIFSLVLAYYNMPILIVFFIGSGASLGWIFLFMKWRKELDYAHFSQNSENQNTIYEIISGMPDIKLNNAERQLRWDWERQQGKIFKLNIRGLSLSQWQGIGNKFIDQFKNILISYIAVISVINGKMTFGMMMSVSYITGQMSGPIGQLLEFFRSAQDAKISLDRLKEVHDRKNENHVSLEQETIDSSAAASSVSSSLNFNKVSFQYAGPSSPYILKDLDLMIEEGKITAIVGTSGSGKTTLLKLLLKFYTPQSGIITLGDKRLETLDNDIWRGRCGVVMQDGYIFGKSIAQNIALGFEEIDQVKLRHAIKVANINEFIENLPLGANTKIGNAGSGISQGQKQRLLIARAVYKNPEFIFFDEATSSLDANNEKVIMENLNEFFKSKTVVIVAHRLSTVKHANKIVVLEKGEIVEQGNHQELTSLKGRYYGLVKNQLELGN